MDATSRETLGELTNRLADFRDQIDQSGLPADAVNSLNALRSKLDAVIEDEEIAYDSLFTDLGFDSATFDQVIGRITAAQADTAPDAAKMSAAIDDLISTLESTLEGH